VVGLDAPAETTVTPQRPGPIRASQVGDYPGLPLRE